MRIVAPNHTQTPNDLFDHWLPLLGEGELKVLLVIIRKTFGWHKIRDNISLSQLEKLTGLTKTNILAAVRSLVSKGLVLKEVHGNSGFQETWYELVIEDSNSSYQSCSDTPPSPAPIPPPVPEKDPQKKPSKQIEKQQQAAAVFFDCLREESFTEADKVWITKNYSECEVINALANLKNVPIKTTPIQTLKWLLKEKPVIAPKKEDLIEKNREMAKPLDNHEKDGVKIEVGSDGICFIFTTAQRQPEIIRYDEVSFKERISHLLRKYGFFK